MMIKGDYLVIEPGDDDTVLVETQSGDEYSGDCVHWGQCTHGYPFTHHKTAWYYRRPLRLCSPRLIAIYKGEVGESIHF